LITFAELEADPFAYQDKLIRVTGNYVALPAVECVPHSGPAAGWALVAEDLRLDILGFQELLVGMAPQELTLTLDGILRRYDGPLGCGKRPAAGILWYLEALQIIQPNPLIVQAGDSSGGPPIIPPAIGTATLPPADSGTVEPEATTGPGTPTNTATPTGTMIATTTSTPVTTPIGQTPGAPTATPTRTPTPSRPATSQPGTPTRTATPTRTPTPVSGPTQPPLPTATPGGYPAPPTSTAYP
jgi:hypothetical protein